MSLLSDETKDNIPESIRKFQTEKILPSVNRIEINDHFNEITEQPLVTDDLNQGTDIKNNYTNKKEKENHESELSKYLFKGSNSEMKKENSKIEKIIIYEDLLAEPKITNYAKTEESNRKENTKNEVFEKKIYYNENSFQKKLKEDDDLFLKERKDNSNNDNNFCFRLCC